jgi:hypothetical protein
MKILAGVKGAPLFGCMVEKIVGNVAHRFYPDNALAITGPMALQECYEAHPENVSVTYHDTREAAFPWSGMRAMDKENTVLALETPAAGDRVNYKTEFFAHEVYRSTCPLHHHHKELSGAARVGPE